MASLKFLTELDCKLLQLIIFLCCLTISVSAGPGHVLDVCSNDANFTANSTYATNRQALLASLSSTKATYDTGFYNSSIGNSPNGVYGLFLCRGDVDTATCKDCVTSSANDTKQHCPVQKRAVVYYDECMIRYSDTPIFSIVDAGTPWILENTISILASQLNLFEDILGKLMTKTKNEAANSPRRFSVNKANFTTFKSVYSLGQCTPDLSTTDCESCLVRVLSLLPTDREGARVLTASCKLHYETAPFFDESFITVMPPAPSPLPVSPPPLLPPTKGKDKSSTTLIIAIVVPIAVAVVLFVSGCCFIRRRAKKKYNTVPEDHDGDDITNVESLQFDFVTIESATNQFSDTNKLGEGGFGQVYKGTLPNGQEIAVKRLSRHSGQGAEEFKNEVVLIVKLQHRHLVRLMGFCLEREEKILVLNMFPTKASTVSYSMMKSENSWIGQDGTRS